jgi:autotransporter-associated beta strand protein
MHKRHLLVSTPRLAGSLVVAATGLIATILPASAASLSWDQTGGGALGGTGTWNTSNTNWWNGASDVAWATNTTTGDSATFAGTAGTVTLGENINAKGLTFSTTGYTISGASTLTLGTGGIDASSLSSGTTAISSAIKVDAGLQKWNVGAGATLALGSIGVVGGDATDTYTPNGAIVFIKGPGTVTTTNADGWGWRSGAVAGTGVLGAGVVIDNGDNTYDMASVGTQTSGTSHAIVAPTYTTASNGDAHNVLVTSNTTVSPNASWVSLKVSGATLTHNGVNLYVDTGIILQNGGTIAGSGPIKANADGLYVYVPDTGTISSSLQNNGATAKKLYKAGTGTLTLSGNNTYTGSTMLYEGTLALGASNRISDSSALVLGGGTFATGGFSETMNTLTINTTSVIDFGAGTSALVFADSSAIAWAGTLNLTNFTIGTDSLRFGTTSNGLTASQLSAISLSGYTAGIDGSGFVTFTAVPEPHEFAIAIVALLGVMVFIRRRGQQA